MLAATLAPSCAVRALSHRGPVLHSDARGRRSRRGTARARTTTCASCDRSRNGRPVTRHRRPLPSDSSLSQARGLGPTATPKGSTTVSFQTRGHNKEGISQLIARLEKSSVSTAQAPAYFGTKMKRVRGTAPRLPYRFSDGQKPMTLPPRTSACRPELEIPRSTSPSRSTGRRTPSPGLRRRQEGQASAPAPGQGLAPRRPGPHPAPRTLHGLRSCCTS